MIAEVLDDESIEIILSILEQIGISPGKGIEVLTHRNSKELITYAQTVADYLMDNYENDCEYLLGCKIAESLV